MNQLREVINASAKLAQGVISTLSGTNNKVHPVESLAANDAVAFDVKDIQRGHRFMFGGIHDDALVYPLADSIEAVLAVDARAFANGLKTYTGREHLYTGEGIEQLNERLLIAARASEVRLSFTSSPDSPETCPVINFVARCAAAAWFPDEIESGTSYQFSTRRLADEFWSQRRCGTGKSYAVLRPMMKDFL